ncbi:MAG: hypothetical protein JKY61_05890 [Planctomycetes bacterium]|nr:hypothetical protein [Planctomycetota bacterium]
MGSRHQTWKQVELGSEWIPVGKVRGDSREERRTYSWAVRINEGLPITIEFKGVGVGEYVAVLPDPASILSELQFPSDGRRFDLLDELWLTVQAAPIDSSVGETIGMRWQSSEVRLRLSVREYHRVDIRWKPAHEAMPTVNLKSKAVPSSGSGK